jgi:hypothetical protein
VTHALLRAYRMSERLPVVGGLLGWTRREVADTLSHILDAAVREHVDVDPIVARLDIDEIVARLDIAEVVARLDIDAIVARLDIDAIVARLDIDAIVARLDIDEVIGRINLSRLANRAIEGVDLSKVVRRSASSIVRTRKTPNGD